MVAFRFFKVGSPAPSHVLHPTETNLDRTPSPRRPSSSASWRQAIFQQVKSPNQNNPNEFCVGGDARKYGASEQGRTQKTPEHYRILWRKAIKQQIVLIRMEKENKRLKGNFVVRSGVKNLRLSKRFVSVFLFVQLTKRRWQSSA